VIGLYMRARGIIRLSIILGTMLGMVMPLTGARFGTALAQEMDGRGLDAFTRAVQAYDTGDWNTAAGLLEVAFQAGLSKELTARATLLRAHINERKGALARALQDYSNALWMGTLPVAERPNAVEGKQRVIAALGLNTPAPNSQPASAPSAPQGSSGGFFGMFGGAFGSSNSAAAAPPSPPPPPPPPVQTAQPAQTGWQAAQASSASAVLSRPKEADARPAKSAAPQKIAQTEKPPVQSPVRMASIRPAAISPASSANGFLIVFGSANSEAAGRTRAQQIKSALADILVSRELDVEASPNGGFQITAGPYKAKSSALALCSAMKQRGVACAVMP
jgi:SPOR domain